MEITEQLTDLGTVEVSSHGPQDSYFEPTAARCSTSSNPGYTDDEK